MPTGYTHDVQSGEVTDFPTFAMRCARRFGALITMRDDPIDAAVPEQFKPSDHHRQQAEAARAGVTRLEGMTRPERAGCADKANAETLMAWEKRGRDRAESRQHYEAMLAEAKDWNPPTSDHSALKDFMIEQLEQSIKFDCSPTYDEKPATKTPDEWHAEALSVAYRDIKYHEKEHAEEVERAGKRTEWVQQLRASLAQTNASVGAVQ